MPERFNNPDTATGGRRRRNRLRGICTGRAGKTIGLTSIAAPVIGYIVKDLRRPDSIIRRFIGKTVNELLAMKSKKVEAIDISSRVEIIDDNSINED